MPALAGLLQLFHLVSELGEPPGEAGERPDHLVEPWGRTCESPLFEHTVHLVLLGLELLQLGLLRLLVLLVLLELLGLLLLLVLELLVVLPLVARAVEVVLGPVLAVPEVLLALAQLAEEGDEVAHPELAHRGIRL